MEKLSAVGGRLLVACLGLVGLYALTWWTSPPLRVVASLEAVAPTIEPADAPEGDLSNLATQVRYSSPLELGKPTRVTVRVRGSGQALVSLLREEQGDVREAWVAAPGQVRFAEVEPGEWTLRLAALPGARAIRAEAQTGGPSWGLFSAFAGLLLLPLLWPYRRKPVETWRRLTQDPS